jgi:tight adherence protein C
MISSFEPWILIGSVFLAVGGMTALIGLHFEKRGRLRARLSDTFEQPADGAQQATLVKKVVDRLDDGLLGLEDPKRRSKLRTDLIRAGFFSREAPKYFVIAQSLSVICLPLVGYELIRTFRPGVSASTETLYLAVLMALGYYGPLAYVHSKRAKLRSAYRVAFPDLLDLVIVCVDAGLSLNAALAKVTAEFKEQSRELAINLEILLSEIRSGRSLGDGLNSLSDRLDLEEARSFSTLIKQSIELGSDVGDAMRVYADEMRGKRLLRAEEVANALPVKMLLPLGLFIFPVIMMVVLTPALIQVFGAFKQLVLHRG